MNEAEKATSSLVPATASLQQHSLPRSELRSVLAMAVPMIVLNSSRALMDVADYILIRYMHSDAAQAAILPAQMMTWSLMITGVGVVAMVNTFSAQALGRGDRRECSAYAWQVFYFSVVYGVAVLLFLPILPWGIRLLGHEVDVQQMELAYAQVALLTIAPTIASMGLAAFFTGVHQPWTSVWSVLEANVLNIVVSAILVFGLFGCPKLGIAGAAWGTVAAVNYRTLRLAISLVGNVNNAAFDSRRTWRPSWSRMKNLLRIGMPCGFQWLNEVVVWGSFVAILVGTKFGTADLVATNTAWQYMRMAFLPTAGVGQALTALVGRAIGAGDYVRARKQTSIVVLLTLSYMGLLSGIYAWFGVELIGLFNSNSDVVAIGRKVMLCAAVFQLFDALGITYVSALRGAGDTFVPSMFFVVSHWLVIIGGGWIIVATLPELRSLGPWMAASALIVITGIFLWWRWRSGKWMHIDIFGSGDLPS